MTRLRYKPNKFQEQMMEGPPVLCNTKFFVPMFVPSTLIWYIYLDGQQVAGAQEKSLSSCKKRLKQELKNLGANFGSEVRNRGNTEKL